MSGGSSRMMKFASILAGLSMGVLWGLTSNGSHGWLLGAIWAAVMPPCMLANPAQAVPRILIPIFGTILLPLLIWVSVDDGVPLLLGRVAAALVVFASQWLFVTERDKILKKAE